MQSLGRKKSAFTLVEMMVVIILISIATGIVAPAIVNLSPYHRLRSGARTLGSNIEFIMDEAVSNGRTLYLFYDLDENSFWIFFPPTKDQDGNYVEGYHTPSELIPRSIKIRKIKLPNGYEYASGTVSIEFNPIRTSGTHIIELENENKEIISIKANAFSGIISFFLEEMDFHEYYE